MGESLPISAQGIFFMKGLRFSGKRYINISKYIKSGGEL
jgi:hypothetical protein